MSLPPRIVTITVTKIYQIKTKATTIVQNQKAILYYFLILCFNIDPSHIATAVKIYVDTPIL